MGATAAVQQPSSLTVTNPVTPGKLTVAVVSDTHNHHRWLMIPPCDVLIHCGDFTYTGRPDEVEDFVQWMNSLHKIPIKLVIAGNHETTFEPAFYAENWERWHDEPYNCEETRRILLSNPSCIYLQHEAVHVNGYKVFGSPYQPTFMHWAF